MTHSTLSKTEQRTEYNVILLGSQACGKSALVSRFMDSDVYSGMYQETMLDQYKQLMYMLDSKGRKNRQVNLNIRDVGHKYARDSMVKEMDAFIVCFDITKQDSFFEVSKICKMLMEVQWMEGSKKPVLVVGLKTDLAEQERQIDYQDAEKTAEAFSAPYTECSAKEDYNVEGVFDHVLMQIFKLEKKQREKKKVFKSILIEENAMNLKSENKACCLIF